MSPRTLIALAALNGFIATAASALGAHLLASKIGAQDMGHFQQAANFQFIHAFALIGAAFAADRMNAKWAGRAGVAFLIGIIAFSGSLYLRAVFGPGSLGSFHWVTPLGGLSLMAGWLMLMIAGLKKSA